MSSNILDDYVDLGPFSKEIGRHSRTVRRWLNQPDGLPYTRIGNRILIHIPTARAWLLGRMRHGAPGRRERASVARSKSGFQHNVA
jgi:hypothetical protein